MQSGTGNFARRIKPIYIRAAKLIHGNTTHMIMSGRPDRDWLNGRVKPRCKASRVDRWETRSKSRCQWPRIQKHTVIFGEMRKNATRHHVPGRKILAIHEEMALFIHKPCTFAAHRLRHKRQRRRFNRESRRMELNKLQILQSGTTCCRKHQAMPDGPKRICAMPEKTANASGGKQNPVCRNIGNLFIFDDLYARDPGIANKNAPCGSLKKRNGGGLTNLANQRLHDGGTGTIATAMQNAMAAMCGLQPQSQIPISLAVKIHTICQQRLHKRGSSGDDFPNSFALAQPCPGCKRISNVKIN